MPFRSKDQETFLKLNKPKVYKKWKKKYGKYGDEEEPEEEDKELEEEKPSFKTYYNRRNNE